MFMPHFVTLTLFRAHGSVVITFFFFFFLDFALWPVFLKNFFNLDRSSSFLHLHTFQSPQTAVQSLVRALA